MEDGVDALGVEARETAQARNAIAITTSAQSPAVASDVARGEGRSSSHSASETCLTGAR
jgi:hypothetical protein